MNKQIKFTYLAQAQPKNDPAGKDFEQVWAECGGKYPYQVIAIDAIPLMNDTGFTYKNILCLSSNLYVLFAEPIEVGVFCIFDDWNVVSVSDTMITFKGRFGCAVQPRALVGVIQRF